MTDRAIRMMVAGAAGGTWMAVAFSVLLLGLAPIARAQLGPVVVDGFLEYQYRQRGGTGPNDVTGQLSTLRTNVSTYLWRPWILRVNASLGLTETVTENNDAKQNGTLITGGLRVDFLRDSKFPFAAYFESRDGRIDGDLLDVDVITRTYGFLQQYIADHGGRFSLDYRRRTVNDLFADGSRVSRNSVNDTWQASAQKTLGRSRLVFNSVWSDITQTESQQSQETMRHTLRHRVNSRKNFLLENILFFSNERYSVGEFDRLRRFLQFNTVSSWRPDTQKPLLIVGRGLLQGIDVGSNGFEQGSRNLAVTVSATYQYSDRVVFAANTGVSAADTQEGDDRSSAYQRLRADYRSRIFDLWRSDYRWGGSAEVGNRNDRDDLADGNSVQDLVLSFNHHLARRYQLSSGRNFEFNFSQQLTGAVDTDERDLQYVTHTAYATLSRQLGQTRSYVRLTATDRRTRGDQRDIFQLLNLQASRSTQTDRHRAWSGSLTLQYGRTARQDSGAGAGAGDSDSQTISYSANLTYRHTHLFNVTGLSFNSELEMLSSDFISNEPFENEFDADRERTDSAWRNRLDYRVGLLQLRLEVNMRAIDSFRNSIVFFSIRRYYGIR
jgi:hypothetical protein